MERLSAALSRERLLLELVLYKVVCLCQILVAGETRFIGWAAEEVERATDRLRQAELSRAVVVAGIAADADLASDISLRALAELADEPYRTILADHARGFTRLTAEVADRLGTARRLSQSGMAGVSATLDRLTASGVSSPAPEPSTYTPAAQWERPATGPRITTSL